MRFFNSVLLIVLMVTCVYAPTNAQTSPTTYQLVGHLGDKIHTFDWSPDGTSLVTGSAGVGTKVGEQINTTAPVVKIWSVSFADGRLVMTETATIGGFEKGIRLVKWSPDGRKIAIIEDRADKLRIWDVPSQIYSAEIPYISYRMHWGADSQSLIFAAQEVFEVDAQTGQVVSNWPLPLAEQPQTENPWWIPDAQINPSGDLLAAITPLQNERYKFVIWDLQNGGEPLLIDNVGYDMAWSPDGRYLATYTGIFDARTGAKVVDSSTMQPPAFLYPDWSADGTYLATGNFIVNAATGSPVGIIEEEVQYVATVTAWNPQENVVACLIDGVINFWMIVAPSNTASEANAGPVKP